MSIPHRALLMFGVILLAVSGAPAQETVISPEELNALGYFKYWEMTLDLQRARAINGAHVLDDTLYIITDSGDVHAVHAAVGLQRWAQNITTSAYRVYPPTHFLLPDGRALALITTSPRMTFVDRYQGDVVADLPIEKAAVGPAVAQGERMYFGSSDGHLYAMIWSDPRTNTGVNVWRAQSDGPLSGAPVLINNGDDMVFASQGGVVRSCTTGAKLSNWVSSTEGPIIADVVVDGPGVFVASTDRSLYRFNLLSGSQEWRLRFPEPLNESPAVSGGIVFQYCQNEGVTAVDAESGERIWQHRGARRLVCRGVDDVILAGESGELFKLSAAKGEVLARIRLPGNVVTVTNVRDNTIYLASHAGSVFCAKPVGTMHLTPEELADARRELRAPADGSAGADSLAPPPRRPAEPGQIDPNDPLRSPSDPR